MSNGVVTPIPVTVLFEAFIVLINDLLFKFNVLLEGMWHINSTPSENTKIPSYV